MKKPTNPALYFIGVFVIYLLVSLVLFFPRWSHLSTHYGTPDVDTDGTLWYQWARMFSESEKTNFSFTNRLIAFPFGYDVTFIPFFSLIYEVNILAMKALGGGWPAILLVANVSTLLTYPLASFFAFGLTFYLTRKKYVSFLSGLIYGFSYYHVLMLGGSLSLNHIQFIPLFYLTFLYFLDHPNWKSLLLSGIAFTVMFMSNAYWAFFSMVFTPLFFVFYGQHSIEKRVKLFLIFYPVVLLLTIVTNLHYIYTQMYNLSSYQLQYVHPKAASVKDQLLNSLAFFAPSSNALVKPWQYSKTEHTLGFTAVLMALLGVLFSKRNKNYVVFLLALLLAIVLASNIPPLLGINTLYFQFFKAFRAVSRLVILASLFVGILFAFSLDEVMQAIKQRFPQKNVSWAMKCFAVLLPLILIAEGFSVSTMSRRLTNFERIDALYQPLKNDPTIQHIIGYPVVIPSEGDGFPKNYELLGQIVHHKSLVGGLSRIIPESRAFQETVKDLADPQTIPELRRNDVDTIVLYMNMYGSAEDDLKRLIADDRVSYVGMFEQPKDEVKYVSENDLSRKIAVFKILPNVQPDANPKSNRILQSSLPSLNFSQRRVSATEYAIELRNVKDPFSIDFREPYSTQWQVFSPKKSIFGNISYSWQSPMFVFNHQQADGSRNRWLIDPKSDFKSLPFISRKVNQDGSYDIDLVLLFRPSIIEETLQKLSVFLVVLLIVFGIGKWNAK